LTWNNLCYAILAKYLVPRMSQLKDPDGDNLKVGNVAKGCVGRVLIHLIVENQIKPNKIKIKGIECNRIINRKRIEREIAEKDPVIQQVIPKEAQITKIVPICLPRLKLITEENLVRAIPEPAEELEAKIIYELNSDQWESRINLKTEKVEEVNFLSEKKE